MAASTSRGEEVQPLVQGAASLVIKTDGSASVGVWGRDFTMGPDIASVRQNLALMVDNGQLDPALDENDTSKWGATLGNKALVWRSGVGVDANGALIYAGGNSLSVLSLARTLQAAGAVRAMELDINTDWVSAYTYVNDPATDPNAPVIGLKLGGDMSPRRRPLSPARRARLLRLLRRPQGPARRRPDHHHHRPDHDHHPAPIAPALRKAQPHAATKRSGATRQRANAARRVSRLAGSESNYLASRSRLQEFMQ